MRDACLTCNNMTVDSRIHEYLAQRASYEEARGREIEQRMENADPLWKENSDLSEARRIIEDAMDRLEGAYAECDPDDALRGMYDAKAGDTLAFNAILDAHARGELSDDEKDRLMRQLDHLNTEILMEYGNAFASRCVCRPYPHPELKEYIHLSMEESHG